MEPLQTWWTTELYPTSDEDNFGVVGNFEVVKAADAQATIAALEQRVKELKQWVQDQSTANLETMRHTDEMQSRALEAEQQLAQRTAELEALRKWRDYVTVALQRPGGAFFEDVPKHIIDLVAELERVRAQVQQLEKDNATLHQFWMNADDWLAYNDKQAAIQRERDILRTLVAALPKVEGAVVVSNGYVKDSTRCHALFGADEDAASYAALLRERQKLC